jgi:hypothetical protein
VEWLPFLQQVDRSVPEDVPLVITADNYATHKPASATQRRRMSTPSRKSASRIPLSGVASVKVAKGAKAEGELVIAGTQGYIYVPAPWWKTDYFEVRYEKQEDNKRFFYQLDGEGIRYEIVAFAKAIESGKDMSYVSKEISEAISGVIEDFNLRIGMTEIQP